MDLKDANLPDLSPISLTLQSWRGEIQFVPFGEEDLTPRLEVLNNHIALDS